MLYIESYLEFAVTLRLNTVLMMRQRRSGQFGNSSLTREHTIESGKAKVEMSNWTFRTLLILRVRL
jgi:hypothetical protein